jgi:hypothetical protein
MCFILAKYMVICANVFKPKNIYKNTKVKLHKTSAAIWYNEMCKLEQLAPKCIQIKINGNSRRVPTQKMQQ